MWDLWTVGLLMISRTAAMVAALLMMKNLREILPSVMPSPLTMLFFKRKLPAGLAREGTSDVSQTTASKI
jgi:hypothetical protein